jgi:hypothetical protein
MSILVYSAFLDKIYSKTVKDCYIVLISVSSCVLFAVILVVSILHVVAWAYVILGR